MEFFRRPGGVRPSPARVGILAGAFNPVTVAHLALARAALSQAGSQAGSPIGEVVFVLPKIFPHKPYRGAPFAERVQMLHAAVADEPAFSIAAADGGLFVEIAAECRQAYGEDARLTFLCGRDAAERILNWDYGDPEAVNKMLRQFDLLVAARRGELEIVANARHSVRIMALDGDFDHVSSTEVRERIAQGLPWEHLAPEGARELVRRVYG
jgi:nicotinate-nucleotide adenylyltransferase